METRKILVATDYSQPSRAVMQYAVAIARDWDAVLFVVHVKELKGEHRDVHRFREMAEDPDAKHQIEMLKRSVPWKSNVKTVKRLLSGDPAKEIVHCAELENVDLIVIGTHGNTGLAWLLMGSVAEAVVRNASCPVLTVKQLEKAKQEMTHILETA